LEKLNERRAPELTETEAVNFFTNFSKVSDFGKVKRMSSPKLTKKEGIKLIQQLFQSF
jgi:hypothetical protein